MVEKVKVTVDYSLQCSIRLNGDILLLLHPFKGLFFQDNLGKPVPERQN